MSKTLTIDEIAELAGVSKSTVSKALNNRRDVSSSTREKILTIIQEHDFTPNSLAKSLKSKRTGNIGVIFTREKRPLSNNPFFSRVLEGIEAELALNGCNLVLKIIKENKVNKLPTMIKEQQIDGLILMGIFENQFIRGLVTQQIPAVQIDPKANLPEFSQVFIDNVHGGYLATKYLLDHGHRRIGFVSGDITRLSFQQRLTGYKKALASQNIPVDESLIRTGGFEQGYQHVKYLVENSAPTAIFVANDLNALLAYSALHEMGLKIPQDMSVIGFDNIWQTEFCLPPLTTIRVYKEELGSIGVRMLLNIINGETDKPITTIVPVRLVERKSVAVYEAK